MKRKISLSLILSLLPAAALAQEQPPALDIDRAEKIVRIQLAAGEGEANEGLNFNGYSEGGATLTIPRGWSVEASLLNQDNFRHHSLVLIPADPSALDNPEAHLALSGASTPNPGEGLVPGEEGVVRFVATEEGEYYLACGVLDHAAQGMWIRVVVAGPEAEPSLSPSQEPPTGLP
jgi:sulfocyanin